MKKTIILFIITLTLFWAFIRQNFAIEENKANVNYFLKMLIISKKNLQNSPYKKSQENFEVLIPKLPIKTLISTQKKLEKINAENTKYKDIINYIKARIGFEIYWREKKEKVTEDISTESEINKRNLERISNIESIKDAIETQLSEWQSIISFSRDNKNYAGKDIYIWWELLTFWKNYHVWEINYMALPLKKEDFLDPLTKEPQLIAIAKGKYQIVTFLEGKNWKKIVKTFGTYAPQNTINLKKWVDYEIIQDDTQISIIKVTIQNSNILSVGDEFNGHKISHIWADGRTIKISGAFEDSSISIKEDSPCLIFLDWNPLKDWEQIQLKDKEKVTEDISTESEINKRNLERISNIESIKDGIETQLSKWQSIISFAQNNKDYVGKDIYIWWDLLIFWENYYVWEINYIALAVRKEDFLDPLTKEPQLIAIAKEKYQIITFLEGKDWKKIVKTLGTYAPQNTINLKKWVDYEIIKNDTQISIIKLTIQNSNILSVGDEFNGHKISHIWADGRTIKISGAFEDSSISIKEDSPCLIFLDWNPLKDWTIISK
jgi:hypothetical protein